ncbi:glucose 1-dehydrogenase [Bernardetia sp. Wsw4-3y2]|uniref:glucose 1-dehydrogenase n=1 Tax=Bernardetia sp. Wsw4-3y2 TaxID=3127471 RepID=UPI0030CB217D
MFSLKEKSIIITGGAMGLGYATAELFAEQGAYLTLVDYNEEKLEEAKKELSKKYSDAKILTVVADVSKEDQVKNYVDKTIKEYSRIDGLYNNAGIEGETALLTEYDMDAFKKVIDINLMGVYYGMRYVIPVMQKQKYGRIVNVASVAGIRGVKNETPYVASKHAVSGMTKNAALEYGQDGIMTNAIAPGAIVTPMVEEAFKKINPDDPKSAKKEYAKANPTLKLGEPKDVATLVGFLLSEECSYVSGQVIAVDGGQSSIYGDV